MGGYGYVAKHKNIVTPRQAQRLGYGYDATNNGIDRFGKQTISGIEKYQVTDIVGGIKVIRTKFRLKKRKVKKK